MGISVKTSAFPKIYHPENMHGCLTLPDPTENLRVRGEYGIQLANEGLWDATLSEHTLSQGLLITEDELHSL